MDETTAAAKITETPVSCDAPFRVVVVAEELWKLPGVAPQLDLLFHNGFYEGNMVNHNGFIMVFVIKALCNHVTL